LTPGSIGKPPSATKKPTDERKTNKESKHIWEDDEVEEVEDVKDPRPRPKLVSICIGYVLMILTFVLTNSTQPFTHHPCQ
jgi:hypothetical protein